jgi:hypothetical protein
MAIAFLKFPGFLNGCPLPMRMPLPRIVSAPKAPCLTAAISLDKAEIPYYFIVVVTLNEDTHYIRITEVFAMSIAAMILQCFLIFAFFVSGLGKTVALMGYGVPARF